MGKKQKRHKGVIYPDEIYNLKVQNKNIPFEIAKKYFNTAFNSKLKVEYKCNRCGKQDSTQFRHIKERETDIPYCNKCWLAMRTWEDPNWIKKNSDTQLIVQNKPEVKEKNRKSVKKFWLNNPNKLNAMREKVLENPNVKNFNYNNGYYILNNGEKILFESNYELLYIWYCEENNINIRRFNKNDGYIPYYNPVKQKESFYKPDFIVHDKIIVEVKGPKIFKVKEKQLIFLAKEQALKESGREHIFIFKDDLKNLTGIKRFRKGSRIFDEMIKSLIENKKIIINSKKYKEYYNARN